MKYSFIIALFILFCFGEMFGQSTNKRCSIISPISSCIKEDDNGNININWDKAIDNEGVFLKYELFSTESPFVPFVTFNKIDSINFTLPSIYRNNHFYIKTSIFCSGLEKTFYTDTTTILSLSNIKIDEGTEKLIWDESIDFSKTQLIIDRKKENENWITIDTIIKPTNFYLDTVDICNKNLLYYRIGINKNGCVSFSNLVKDTLKDMYHPNIPTIKSIGFDTLTNNLLIKWNKAKEKDVQGYIIYQEVNNLSTTLDTVIHNGISIDTFYTIFNPSTSIISNYRVAAYDFCYSLPPKFQTSAQSSVFQSTLLQNEYNVCTKEIKIYWNEILTNDDIINYNIFYKKENEHWNKIDSTTKNNYKFYLDKFSNYKISVELVSKNGNKSFSSINKVYSKSPSEPKVSFTNYATVLNNNLIEIKHSIEKTSGLNELALFKKNENNEFVEIDRKAANSNTIIFNDKDVSTQKYKYEYYIQHVDSCNNLTQKNKIQRTILLNENSKNQDSLSITFNFSPYLGFKNSISKYIIKRAINSNEFVNHKEIYSDSTFLVREDFNDLENFEGKVCYQIEAIENNNEPNISQSNEICFDFDPRIYIPNAFTPNGQNPNFKPIISTYIVDSYELEIINRWGQSVFQTTDENIGWNGKFGNEESPNGLYVYHLKINSGSDKEIIKRGLIHLIR